MGLLSIIRKQKLKDKEIRVLLLGLDNSGKTTIVKSLLNEDVKEVSPTMGFNINTLSYQEFTLNIWDIGGQSTLRPFWFNYFERTDSLVWVVDVSAINRLRESFQEFEKVLQEDRLVGCNLLILLNKIDIIPTDKSLDAIVSDVVEELHLKEITNHCWNVLPVSAYTGQNLHQGIDWVVEEVKKRLYIL
ncbi:GTP-binding protein involved in beta-tubulin (Tub2p) folding [Komagataella phaffii CBS 7435]|uniref:GTP-binding protein involved in beta-tubulin (Tub2p) folding n=2 Tax=Komagataella phaffii TaxID=460519 RepID=C4R7C1_KOMPG|nr:GTP-binding protein involved in beta-tubulin (Tub2p) folding [Komagataella phaffii GS115]AOA65338.1 GQ67_04589T0 [Komagataella phaffii]CAH2451131.1 GTP-binding protein involved in beta-tubulin (Tub2p) folding [Komagataella phaffii CBS 7435]AOA69829.1 GQ68_04561T0 [Komagataella phaffii GS115]CAY71496.1 GTP-binding protein involved in beta-tubulin (Tub2p) folding [Komagataella phaffii GS115]CCA40895.1 GTP-binding protein involved in beta-tubulin (Tub2p) folding [Komagataella phaffii CBS 7435]